MNWNRMSLFKLPNRHKRFEYIPRYYDPKKEELKKKLKQAESATDANGNYQREISFRHQTADKWGNTDFKREAMRSNLRLIIIFGIILLLVVFLFQYIDVVGAFIDNNKGK